MKIILDDNFYIDSDKYSVMLHQKSEKINAKTGQPGKRWYTTYFPNLRLALIHYLDDSLKESKSAEEILERIQIAESKIEAIGKIPLNTVFNGTDIK